MNGRQIVRAVPTCIISALLVYGCGLGTDSILFITKTSVGVDVDSKPPTLDIGFDRKEGVLAPEFSNGEVLPVMAGFAGKLGIVNQAIGQSYATGHAAILMAKYLGSTVGPAYGSSIPDTDIAKTAFILAPDLRKRYYFGTDTSFGFRINFGLETGGYPDSLSFGYKRKEFAFVPLMTTTDANGNKVVALPSLIATVGQNAVTTTPDKTNVLHTQFFGTGMAANYLAAQPGIRASVASRIMPESKAENDEVLRQLSIKRADDFAEAEKQARVDKILDGIDKLPRDKVFELNETPPVQDAQADQLVNALDPGCVRQIDRDCNGSGPVATGLPDEAAARKMLKTRAAMSNDRSDAALNAWEAVLDANK